MKILYNAILKAFKTETELYQENDPDSLFIGIDAMPPLYIDLYDSQPEMPDQFEGFICPALLIDYSISWERKGNKRVGTISLVAHVLTDANEETSNISEQPDDLKKIDYYETIGVILEGISTEETSQLILTDERPVSTDYFDYHQLTFECTITRRINSKRRYVDGKIEKINIDGNIKKSFDYDIQV